MTSVNIKMCTGPKETLTYKTRGVYEDVHCSVGCESKNLWHEGCVLIGNVYL